MRLISRNLNLFEQITAIFYSFYVIRSINFVKAVFYEVLYALHFALIFAVVLVLGVFGRLVCLLYPLNYVINRPHFVGALSARSRAEILEVLEVGVVVANTVTLLRSPYNKKFVNQRALAVTTVSVIVIAVI